VFHDNVNTGLLVSSNGAISAVNLSARGNVTDHGVYLYNASGIAGITLTGINVFTGNGGSGLHLYSNGAVSLTQVTADENAQSGVYADFAGSLKITCGSFTNNGTFGLYVSSPVAPYLVGVFASGNNPGSGNLIWAGHGAITSDVRACP